MKKKFIIITTVPISLSFFKGQIQILKETFDIELISSAGKNLKKIAKQERVSSFALEMKREISILHDIKSLLQLISLFLKRKPYVVHGSTPKAGLLSMIAAWLTKTPVRIYYIHGLRYHGATGIKKKILMVMEKLSCFFATNVFSVSNGVKSELKANKITNKEIKVIWNGSVNGIDTKYFSTENTSNEQIKEKYAILDQDFVYGFVGRLVSDKGINELVRAFLKVNLKHKNTKLLLVGSFEDLLDPLEEKVKNEIENNPAIIYAGYQSDIRPFFKLMDLFVFPSYREGFGVSLMEAAAMGVPAISTNIIGCNEIVKNAYNGLLILPKSENDLLKSMLFLLESETTLNEMAKVCRHYVIDKYEQQELWQKTMKAYTQLIN